MSDLTSKQRKILERHAQALPATVLIGGSGVTEAVIGHVATAITANELVKIKFNEYKDEKIELSNKIAEATHATLVRVIGNTAIFYREAKQADKRRFASELSKA